MTIKEAKHLNELEDMLQSIAVRSVLQAYNQLMAHDKDDGTEPVPEIAAIFDWHDTLVEEALTILMSTKGRYPMD